MQISVTKQNIEEGDSCSAHHCPIALAIRDLYPYAKFVTVGENSIYKLLNVVLSPEELEKYSEYALGATCEEAMIEAKRLLDLEEAR